MKAKSDLASALLELIDKYRRKRNIKAVDLEFLLTDYCKEAVESKKFLKILSDREITLNLSSPHNQSQNLTESFMMLFKNGMRTTMIYNKAPLRFWDYAVEYYWQATKTWA